MATIIDERERRANSFGDAAAAAQNPTVQVVAPAPAAPTAAPIAPPSFGVAPTAPPAVPAAPGFGAGPMTTAAAVAPPVAPAAAPPAAAAPAPAAPAPQGDGFGAAAWNFVKPTLQSIDRAAQVAVPGYGVTRAMVGDRDNPFSYTFGATPAAAAAPQATQAQVRAVDNNPANAAAIAAAPVAAPSAAAPALGTGGYAPSGSVTSLGGFGAAPTDRVAQLGRDAASLRALSDRSLENARQGIGVPATPGLGVINGDWANRNAGFNAQANVNTLVARGAMPGRGGVQALQVQLDAAGAPLARDAAQAALATREAGDTQRAQIQEAGADARARIVDARQQQSNAIDQQRVGLEAQRLGIDAARAARAGVPEGYRLKADGTGLEPIPGGPKDPNQSTEQRQLTKDAQDIFDIIGQARTLLPNATNSTIGNAADATARAFGFSTAGAEVGAQLKALQGALVSKMPKMSGPQSDKDVQLYREMAGQIGDPTIPHEQRLKALDIVQSLQLKYLPAPTDAAAFAALPSGTTYRSPDGQVRRKP